MDKLRKIEQQTKLYRHIKSLDKEIMFLEKLMSGLCENKSSAEIKIIQRDIKFNKDDILDSDGSLIKSNPDIETGGMLGFFSLRPPNKKEAEVNEKTMSIVDLDAIRMILQGVVNYKNHLRQLLLERIED